METPLFCGEGDPTSAQVRVSSIRGGMHFWLRAMAGVFAKNNPNALRRIENHVLGSTDAASPIRLRIPEQPAYSTEAFPDFMPRDARNPYNKWIGYLLGPGLTSWEPKDEARRLKGAVKITRAFVPPGEEFDLRIKLVGKDHDAQTVALGALWMSLVFGGIGARTRRGFGGVRIVGVDGPGLAGWDPDSLLTPGLDFYERTKNLWFAGDAAGPTMASLKKVADKVEAGPFDSSTTTPSFPVLSKANTLAGVTGGGVFDDWPDVLRFGGEELRHFRASEQTPEVKYHPKIKTREWLDVVHDNDREDFDIGGLGLPLVFKKDIEVHADSGEGEDTEKLRRASPLWLRAVGEGEHWRLFSFAFLNEFLPEETDVHLWIGTGNEKHQDRPLTVTTAGSHKKVRRWIEGMTDAEDSAFVPGNG
ncbi:type III-B CRISPR module RAMP protein Cmr1 [Nocardiopsis quinghaiensis]|uniref:type III-B CRISPR module RAMP protein Cmr1 n=1 Tax=Nocardiopsis quinghaiensis TaxID=464995 RepID=UPI0021DFB7C1|nr:type III-B CRISPR module RAMP protein Cmr1 [Nocardiopsis quinghaiensis]